jgi:uncharacterized lipoprotein YmbA
MTRHLLLRSTALSLGVLLVFTGGCLGTSPPSRFYLLSPLSSSKSLADVRSGLALGVGPVALPEYLNRAQIVTRAGEHQLELAEFDRWAEPLQRSFARILVMNLSTLLSTDRIALHPWNRSTPIKYQVTVDVARFDAGEDGTADLLVRWSLIDAAERRALLMRKSTFSEAVDADDYEDTVASMSRLVGALSREIAEAIRNVSMPPEG